jgi:hypothetical protein
MYLGDNLLEQDLAGFVGAFEAAAGDPATAASAQILLKSVPDPHRFGVAHGFAALTDMTITYLVDGYYSPADELGVAWNDPAIGADWGVTDPVLSARDQTNPKRPTSPPTAAPTGPCAPDGASTGPDGCVLVRPDGHAAFRSRAAAAIDLATAALASALDRAIGR